MRFGLDVGGSLWLAVGDLGEDEGDEGAEVVEDAGGLAEGLEDGLLAAEG